MTLACIYIHLCICTHPAPARGARTYTSRPKRDLVHRALPPPRRISRPHAHFPRVSAVNLKLFQVRCCESVLVQQSLNPRAHAGCAPVRSRDRGCQGSAARHGSLPDNVNKRCVQMPHQPPAAPGACAPFSEPAGPSVLAHCAPRSAAVCGPPAESRSLLRTRRVRTHARGSVPAGCPPMQGTALLACRPPAACGIVSASSSHPPLHRPPRGRATHARGGGIPACAARPIVQARCCAGLSCSSFDSAVLFLTAAFCVRPSLLLLNGAPACAPRLDHVQLPGMSELRQKWVAGAPQSPKRQKQTIRCRFISKHSSRVIVRMYSRLDPAPTFPTAAVPCHEDNGASEDRAIICHYPHYQNGRRGCKNREPTHVPPRRISQVVRRTLKLVGGATCASVGRGPATTARASADR